MCITWNFVSWIKFNSTGKAHRHKSFYWIFLTFKTCIEQPEESQHSEKWRNEGKAWNLTPSSIGSNFLITHCGGAWMIENDTKVLLSLNDINVFVTCLESEYLPTCLLELTVSFLSVWCCVYHYGNEKRNMSKTATTLRDIPWLQECLCHIMK